MYKMEESYGYNYKEYDEKMDNYLEDITDAQTKIDSKKEERYIFMEVILYKYDLHLLFFYLPVTAVTTSNI